MYLQSIKSVKHKAAKSVNRSILKKSRHLGFGVFIVHSFMVLHLTSYTSSMTTAPFIMWILICDFPAPPSTPSLVSDTVKYTYWRYWYLSVLGGGVGWDRCKFLCNGGAFYAPYSFLRFSNMLCDGRVPAQWGRGGGKQGGKITVRPCF
jgi:hypothetical protein